MRKEDRDDAVRALWSHYWLQVLAVVVALVVLAKVWLSNSWASDSKHLLYGALGLVSVLASDEVASLTGRYGWTRAQWWQGPSEYVKWVGALTLGVCAAVIVF